MNESLIMGGLILWQEINNFKKLLKYFQHGAFLVFWYIVKDILWKTGKSSCILWKGSFICKEWEFKKPHQQYDQLINLLTRFSSSTILHKHSTLPIKGRKDTCGGTFS